MEPIPVLDSVSISQEELYQARLIVARQKFWTKDVEKLLRRWRGQTNLRRAELQLAEQNYNRKYYLLGVPATILSTIVSSGILTTFKNCNVCSDGCIPASSGSCNSDEWIRLAMGLIGIFSIIFTCVSLFMNYGNQSSNSKNAADSYEEITRDIDAILQKPISTRGDAITTLDSIRTRFDDISKKSPSSSSNIKLEYQTLKEKSMRRFSSPLPDQVNIPTGKIPDASKLAKILIDTMETENKEQIKIKKEIADKNDYDTDEENRDVVISFDIDSFRPTDRPEKRLEMQKSLEKALEFELKRMYPLEEPNGGSPPLSEKSPKKTKRKKRNINAGPPKDKEEV